VQELIARIWVDQNDIGCNLDPAIGNGAVQRCPNMSASGAKGQMRGFRQGVGHLVAGAANANAGKGRACIATAPVKCGPG